MRSSCNNQKNLKQKETKQRIISSVNFFSNSYSLDAGSFAAVVVVVVVVFFTLVFKAGTLIRNTENFRYVHCVKK